MQHREIFRLGTKTEAGMGVASDARPQPSPESPPLMRASPRVAQTPEPGAGLGRGWCGGIVSAKGWAERLEAPRCRAWSCRDSLDAREMILVAPVTCHAAQDGLRGCHQHKCQDGACAVLTDGARRGERVMFLVTGGGRTAEF